MGVNDHPEDGTGHILSLALDLDYLHVEGAKRQSGMSTATGSGNIDILQAKTGAQSNNSNSVSGSTGFSSHSSCSSSSCSNFSEESAVSDSDDERFHNGSYCQSQHPQQDQPPEPHHQDSSSVCQTARLDLAPNQSPGGLQQSEALSTTDPVADYRSKVEFALKLGYSEELVLLVLRKLGPGALINDILGELVKLGTKTEMELQGSSTVSQFSSSSLSSSLACSSSSSSSNSPPDSDRLRGPSQLEDKENLRPIVVDGSNVAMSHGNKEVFSCQGIKLAVDWFLERGHRDITVFVPAWRKEQSRPDALITDQEILRRLEKQKILVFTPSRRVQGRRVVCYDDRFIVKLAYECDGIIVSNDNYRDLANEKPEWKKFIDERLLMYSFVNDKFMPPDDPLGRHGPSLENFLRKTPVVSEYRKQLCPYGKKCTYGHKCKFYHPERGSQPQRAVADELRANAKISSAASKGLLEDALKVNCQSSGQPEVMAEVEQNVITPKKQPNTSPQNSFSDLQGDMLRVQSKVEGHRGSNSNGSSSCSSRSGLPAPGGPPSFGNLDRWEHPEGKKGDNSRVAGASGTSLAETYHRCESPDLGYSTLVKAYSSLSLVVPQSPERFLPTDVNAGSLLSDCSSEGSISSDSFSPDPLLDDGPKSLYHHHHYHCSGQYPLPASLAPPGLGYPVLQTLRKQLGFSLEDRPSSLFSKASPSPVKLPSAFIPPQPQHPIPHPTLFSSFPGEFQSHPPRSLQASTAHSHSQNSTLRFNMMGNLWQEGGLQDSQVYKGSPLHSRRNHSGTDQPQHQISWNPHYQQSTKPCYEPFDFQSPPDVHERTWHSPVDRQARSPPSGLSASRLPPLPQLSLAPSPSQLPLMPKHPEPPALDRYQDLRETMFVNLCRIFPTHLVKIVMTRNPLMMDAQELAAAILMEKSQHRS